MTMATTPTKTTTTTTRTTLFLPPRQVPSQRGHHDFPCRGNETTILKIYMYNKTNHTTKHTINIFILPHLNTKYLTSSSGCNPLRCSLHRKSSGLRRHASRRLGSRTGKRQTGYPERVRECNHQAQWPPCTWELHMYKLLRLLYRIVWWTQVTK